MRPRWLFMLSLVVFATAFTGSAAGVSANARVTADAIAGSYLRYDGSSDAPEVSRPTTVVRPFGPV